MTLTWARAIHDTLIWSPKYFCIYLCICKLNGISRRCVELLTVDMSGPIHSGPRPAWFGKRGPLRQNVMRLISSSSGGTQIEIISRGPEPETTVLHSYHHYLKDPKAHHYVFLKIYYDYSLLYN